MGFGSFLKGAFYQLNPFDQGKTFSSAYDEERKRKRAQAALQNTRAGQVINLGQGNANLQGNAPAPQRAPAKPAFNPNTILPSLRVQSPQKAPNFRIRVAPPAQLPRGGIKVVGPPNSPYTPQQSDGEFLNSMWQWLPRYTARLGAQITEAAHITKPRTIDPKRIPLGEVFLGKEKFPSSFSAEYNERRQAGESRKKALGLVGLTLVGDAPIFGGRGSSLKKLVEAATPAEVKRIASRQGVNLSDDAADVISKTKDENIIKVMLEDDLNVPSYQRRPGPRQPDKTQAPAFERKAKATIADNQEYQRAMANLSKNYDKEVAAATKLPAIKQRVVLDEIDQRYDVAIKRLDETPSSPTLPEETDPVITLARKSPELRAELDDIAKGAGYKNHEDMIQATKPKGASNVNNVQQQGYEDLMQQLESVAGNKTAGQLTKGRRGIRLPGNANQLLDVPATEITSGAGGLAGKALGSQWKPVRAVGQALHAVNRKTTLTDSQKSLLEQVQGRQGGLGSLGGDLSKSINKPLDGLDDVSRKASVDKVHEALTLLNDGQKAAAQRIMATLSPQEKAYLEAYKKVAGIVNEANRGGMADEVIDQFADGTHLARLFDPKKLDEFLGRDENIEAWASSQGFALDTNPAKRRKQLDKLAPELKEAMIKDPAATIAIRADIAMHNKAIRQYIGEIKKIPDAVSKEARGGFVQVPDSARYGDLAGQYVRKDFAYPIVGATQSVESVLGRKASEFMDSWQNSIFGKIEDGLRQVLTVYNPATRLGNRSANIVMAQLHGFNFGEMAVRQQHFMNVLGKGGDEMTRLAKTHGAITDQNAMAKLAGVRAPKNRLQKSYTNMDAGAKVAMFEWRIKRGDSFAEAARFVNRALPDVGNSGELYRFFSRLPVLGVPFRAIQPEVMRTLGSAAGRHPTSLVTAMAVYSTFQNWTWDKVPEEERKQIEERFGSGQTPFADINNTLKRVKLPGGDNKLIPDSLGDILPSTWSFNAGRFFGDGKTSYEIDPRRLAGIYSLNVSEGPSGNLLDTARKVSPAPIPFQMKKGKLEFQPQEVVGSRTFGPAYQAIIDRDWRGKSIQDPEGKIYAGGETSKPFVNEKTLQPESKSDPRRMWESIIRGYIPQAGEVDNVIDAKAGRKNFNDQKMSLTQSVIRFGGVKGEEFTKERLKDMTNTQEYYKDLEKIEKQTAKMSPGAGEAWKRLTGYYKLRELLPNSFKPGQERYKKAPVYKFSENKWKDYESNPEIYKLMVDKRYQDNKRSNTPIPPEFDKRLSKAFRKQLVNNKALAPGENVEAQGRMYESPEWDKYQRLQEKYKKAAKKHYGGNDEDFVDELVRHKDAKFPEKGPAKTAYDDAYGLYDAGKGPKPAFTEQVRIEKEAYNTAKWEWTNKERKARGLKPIPKEQWDNETFGYNASKTGKGYGSGGWGGGGRGRSGSGGGGKSRASIPRFTTFINQIRRPSIASAPKIQLKAVPNRSPGAASSSRRININGLTLPNKSPTFGDRQ